jgi:23S rRNA pseudouridine1911/1915/1917 synthase
VLKLNMPTLIFNVAPEGAGKRLDVFIIDSCKANDLGFSRTYVQKLILDGKALLNHEVNLKANTKVKTKDVIEVFAEKKDKSENTAEDITLDIVYEDDDLAIINKQRGLVVHPAPGNKEHTLVNALLYHFKNLSDINPQRPGIVHRLDKETSGLMVIAKNNTSHYALSQQFAEHSIKRKYVALVKGKMEFDEDVIEIPIGRHPRKRKDMAVGFGSNTKYAKTYYRTLKRLPEISMLELRPYTGRTHQLRVHLAYIGHPVLGDEKYGKKSGFKRMALHARYIGFIHPRTKKFIEFEIGIPQEFLSSFAH